MNVSVWGMTMKATSDDGRGAALYNPESAYVSGNYAYIASYESDALEIVDVTDPARPVHKGKITNSDGGALLDHPISVFVFGNYAYVASYGSHALEIIDVSDPTHPTHVAKVRSPQWG